MNNYLDYRFSKKTQIIQKSINAMGKEVAVLKTEVKAMNGLVEKIWYKVK